MEQTSRDGGFRVPPHLTYPFSRPAGKTILRYAMNLPETQKDLSVKAIQTCTHSARRFWKNAGGRAKSHNTTDNWR